MGDRYDFWALSAAKRVVATAGAPRTPEVLRIPLMVGGLCVALSSRRIRRHLLQFVTGGVAGSVEDPPEDATSDREEV